MIAKITPQILEQILTQLKGGYDKDSEDTFCITLPPLNSDDEEQAVSIYFTAESDGWLQITAVSNGACNLEGQALLTAYKICNDVNATHNRFRAFITKNNSLNLFQDFNLSKPVSEAYILNDCIRETIKVMYLFMYSYYRGEELIS